MNYKQSIEYIHSLSRFGSVPGLERISLLLEKLGNPHKSMKFIHVAGTNGKGSTAAFISSALTAAGYKTALYISPYVVCFEERIQIDRQYISRDDLCDIVCKIKSISREMEKDGNFITEFEFVTVAAFLYFRQQHCDFAVIETGMGGRFDATNVIDPLVSVITSISLDHTEILGNTVEKIAFEKAGIIKPNRRTVLYPNQSEAITSVIAKKASEMSNTLNIPDTDALTVQTLSLGANSFTYKNLDYCIKLNGKHLIYNAITAVEALYSLRECDIPLSEQNIQTGLNSTDFPGRFELIKNDKDKNITVFLDGGHNPAAIDVLDKTVSDYLKDIPLIVIMGIMKDKDYAYCIPKIASHADAFISTRPLTSRVLEPNVISDIACKYCDNIYTVEFVSSAIDFAYNISAQYKKAAVLICGSLFLISEARKYF